VYEKWLNLAAGEERKEREAGDGRTATPVGKRTWARQHNSTITKTNKFRGGNKPKKG